MESRIQSFIQERGIKPSGCAYHTQRTVNSRKGEPSGKIRVLVIKGEALARAEYVCPECRHYGYAEQEWKRPFSIKCEKCGFLIKVPKMKQQAKREAKAAKRK